MIAFLLGPFGRIVGGSALVLLALGWSHHAGYKAGVAHQKTEDAKVAYIAKLAADMETARLQGLAHQLETDRDQARTDLDVYRAAHPVHISVCHTPSAGSSVSQGAASGAPGAEASPVLQPETTDIGPQLDSLMAEADGINELYRTCRTAYLEVAASR